MTNPKDCPCGSGKPYKACCGPRHDGTQPAETPEALMRSRWSAFALGRGEYLYDTLAANHPDRAGLLRATAVQQLARAKDRQRFLKLTILEAEGNHVTFHARVFEKGVNCSFNERSGFVKEDGRWKYADGEPVPAPEAPTSAP